MTSRTVHISFLHEHPANIRNDLGDLTELAASIRAQGILQPLIAEPCPARPGHYQVIAGNRRLAAARKARLQEIPVIVCRPQASAKVTEVMLVENCQRADLGPVEKAEAMGRLRDAGYAPARIAQATGLSASTVSYFLSLLDLDEASRERVRNGTVPVGRAIRAVRQTRAAGRRPARGRRAPQPKAAVAADHFSTDHPLAGQVRLACELAGHEGRKLGKGAGGMFGCGACWEAVIRRDERSGQPPVPRVVPLHRFSPGMASRIEDYLMLRRQGHSREQAATRIGVKTRETHRWESALDAMAVSANG